MKSFLCKNLLLLIGLLIYLGIVNPVLAHQEGQPQEEFLKAKVISIDEEGVREVGGLKSNYQNLTLKLLDGPDVGKEVKLVSEAQEGLTSAQNVKEGEVVVLAKTSPDPNSPAQYFVVDKYRLNYLPWLLVFFGLVVVMVAGKKGLGSILGLIVSLGIISSWVVPQILHGADPLSTSIIGSVVILLISSYLAHGFSKQTSVALVATFVCLMITALLAIWLVQLTKLMGLGDETAYTLQIGPSTSGINLQGLLLGGIIIGALGALNDVTTTQAATVFELFKDNPGLKFNQLVKKSFTIGREHILSLVNTLVLAYAGASLVIIIFFVLNPSQQPTWVILNSETIFDEIVRAVVGSIGLILAVPLVTLISAWYVTKNN